MTAGSSTEETHTMCINLISNDNDPAAISRCVLEWL
jgi:hypothetical protein